MWNIGWTRLATLTMVCLAAGQSSAASATQSGGTQAVATSRSHDFSLMPAYPAGIANEEQYQQYLDVELREASRQLDSSPGDDANRIEELLQAATFALTQASEPDLTQAWLWRQPHAAPELAVRALALARTALAAVEGMVERSSGGGPSRLLHADRIQMLKVLLAMEEVLLGQASPGNALRAADLADAAVEMVPAEVEATWELLIAGCLVKAGQRDDAQLRLQRLLGRHEDPAPAVAAVMLQARILAETGNYAAGVGLASESLQALPAMVNQSLLDWVADAAAEAPGVGVVRTSLSLVRARLLAEWAEKIAKSKNELDRQSAADLRKQALDWQVKAKTYGLQLVRLRPMLEGLEQPVK